MWLLCFTKFEYLLYVFIKLSPGFVWGPVFKEEMQTDPAPSPGWIWDSSKTLSRPMEKIAPWSRRPRVTINISICHSTVSAPCLPFLCLSTLDLLHLPIAASPVSQEVRSYWEWRYKLWNYYHVYSITYLTALHLSEIQWRKRGCFKRVSQEHRYSWTYLGWLP